MPRRNVIDVVEGQWLPWHRRERWVCCDCCLTHRVEYRIHEGELEVRMFRENRSTGAYRRHSRIKVAVTKKDTTKVRREAR